LWTLFVSSSLAQTPQSSAVDAALASVRGIGAEGRGFSEAQTAAKTLRQLPSTEVFRVLEAMRDADPVAQNWLRGIASDIARHADGSQSDELISYINNRENSPEGRSVAMSMLERLDSEAYEKLLTQSLEDPSLLIREMAVAKQLATVEASSNENPEQTKELLRRTLQAARHPTQLASVLKKLNDLGEPMTTSQAFAMIENWQTIGPFDNVDGVGFDTAYAPESHFTATSKIDVDTSYEGKHAPVQWQTVQAVGTEGKVDLAETYDKEKGAVAYAYAEFEVAEAMDAQARLGCICANKVWLNGKLLTANEVYHAGSMIDQYTAECRLATGTNKILLKICQNEQTQSWAQDWEFQFRLTDPTGKGLTSTTAKQNK
jgi:hypothetical protein